MFFPPTVMMATVRFELTSHGSKPCCFPVSDVAERPHQGSNLDGRVRDPIGCPVTSYGQIGTAGIEPATSGISDRRVDH